MGRPNIPLRHGAALLPVWSAMTGRGRLATTIGPPLQAESGANARDFLRAAAEGMLDRFAAQVSHWPDQGTLAALAVAP